MLSIFTYMLFYHYSWCGPCKRLTPLLDEKLKSSKGKWTLAKCNIDEFGDLANTL